MNYSITYCLCIAWYKKVGGDGKVVQLLEGRGGGGGGGYGHLPRSLLKSKMLCVKTEMSNDTSIDVLQRLMLSTW